MEDAAAGAPAEGAVDQASYVSDALETPAEGAQAQPPKDEKKDPAQQAQPGKAQPPKADGQPPKTEEPIPDPFDSVFADDTGGLDVKGFTEFAIPSAAEPVVTDLGDGAAEPDDTRSVYERDAEELRLFEQNLRSEVLDPLQRVADRLGANMAPEVRQALEEEYAARQSKILQHVAEHREKRQIERQKEMEEKLLAPTRKAEMAERAKTNTNEVISALPGKTVEAKTNLFNHLLFSKEVGAPILEHYFREKHPDLDKLPPQQRHAKADEFIQSVLSNKAQLRFLVERAFDRATRIKLPSLLQRARLQHAAVETDKRLSAQKHPAGIHSRARPSGNADPFEAYRNSHREFADRV